MRLATLVLVVVGLFAQTGAALATPPAAPLAAIYQATPPASAGAGTDLRFPVTVTNAGTETWVGYDATQPAAVAGQMALAYHWYELASGAVAVWDGVRTPLGAAPVAPQQSRSVTQTVRTPVTPGTYVLRLALVKEGVEWVAPGQAIPLEIVPAFKAAFTAPQLSALVTDQTYSVPVTVLNQGTVTWNATGADPVRLSYHWHDAAGKTVVWDGLRTPLPADVSPGTSATIQARVAAPLAAGIYTLTFDLVRENVAWFQALGSVPARASVSIAPVTYAAQYDVRVSAASYIGETKSIPVSITNNGNVPWTADNVVNLAYHIFDSKGDPVVWDGLRAPIGDLAVGATKQVLLAYVSPTQVGDYTLAIDAVREGRAWFSSLGTPSVRLPMKVESGFGVGYGATTTPGLATIGARVTLKVNLDNYGPRTLAAGGPNPVRLAYHLLSSDGSMITWDGARGILPFDVPPGRSASVEVDVQLPSRVGNYVIQWDLVQEGVAWLSQLGLASKRESITVQPGVTFYGKGFGHGLGMSQYGAQGMATGAGGLPKMSGEQIVAYYYPGTTLSPISPTSGNSTIRVLLSQPSSQGRYSCGAAYFAGSIANLVSSGGFRVLNEGAGNAEVFRASPSVSVQLQAIGGVVRVWNQATATPTAVYEGPGPIAIVPLDASKPTTFKEKGAFRGNFRFTNLGGTLRVLNVVSYDDYVKGVVPLEMLSNWNLEAYKAQAIAARTYAYSSYQGGKRDYDVLEDQSDQCYGGVQMLSGRVVETAITNQAVDLTAQKILTYNGQAIRAYFASSNGGYSKAIGCWANNAYVSGGVVQCGPSEAYLSPVADPWDLSVTSPAPNKNTSWTVTFSSDQIRNAVLAVRGIDIGTLLSVDLSNRLPVVVGHVTSVKVSGTFATVDVPADKLLKDNLFLKSTMVRLAPW
ncbi:MAG: SpoIID/LytB domain-containing protein [Chloroflexi bacterium]|nr:SpoIID/LytB domain-containing protein [Chloroflexota bacterium]